MDLAWTKEQEDSFSTVTAWAKEKFAGTGTPDGFDRNAWQSLAAAGACARFLPRPWGGEGRGALDAVGWWEALGLGGADRGLMFAMGAHLFGCAQALAVHGSSEQGDAWGAKLSNGSAVGALAVTEVEGGSRLTGHKTVATPTGDGFMLDGEKYYVTNAPVADLFLVAVREAGQSGPFSSTFFLVPADRPGLSVEPLEPTLGLAGAPMGAVRFRECPVRGEDIVGRQRAGLQVFQTCMIWERSCLLAGFLGAARNDVRTCLMRLRSRGGKGSSLLDHQAVAHRLARLHVELEAARGLVFRAAWAIDEKSADYETAATAKIAASEAIVHAAREIFELSGGAGWLDEGGAATALRDALGAMAASGTTEVQLTLIAESQKARSP